MTVLWDATEKGGKNEREKGEREASLLISCSGTTIKHSVALDLPLRPPACPRPRSPRYPPTLIATCPSSLSISAKSAESRDDFPQPTWPTTATKEPSGMEKVMLKRHNTCLSHALT